MYPYKNVLAKINENKSNFYLPTKILNNIYITNISNFITLISYFIMRRLLKKKKIIFQVLKLKIISLQVHLFIIIN